MSIQVRALRAIFGLIALAAVLVGSGAGATASELGSPLAQEAGGATVETKVWLNGIEEGIGADQRPAIVRAQDLMTSGKADEAEQALRQVIEAIERQIGKDTRTRVCVANKEEFNRFASDHGGSGKVVWVDWAYREAIQAQAYIAGARGELDKALGLLERVEALSPFNPGAFVERGYVLKRLGRSQEALESYRRAYALSQGFESARASAPAALRGIGFALTELGDLKGARKAYEDSLKLDPGNETALHELDYIRSLEASRP